jgi:PPIC-type PPIASE domain
MPNALQVGQRQLPLHKVLQHLTTSPALFQYLRLSIIEETLVRWQQSPEYQTIYSEAELNELYQQLGQLAQSPQTDPGRIEAFKRSLALKKYQQVHWGHRIPSYFLTRKKALDRAIFSVIQVDSLGMAQELYLRIKDRRQSFDKLARLYSQGAEAKLGGVMGPIAVERIHPKIVYHLSSLKPGELSPLFQLDNFYVFIRLEQWVPARFDDDIKGQLMEELFEQWLHAEIANRIATLAVSEADPISERQDAIEIDAEGKPHIPNVPVVDRSLPALAPQAEVVDTQIVTESTAPAPPQPVTKIDAGVSFFPPVVEAPAPATAEAIVPEVIQSPSSTRIDRSTITAQPSPTHPIDATPPRKSPGFFQKLAAFCVFFTLFLGGGLGAIYVLNTFVGNNGVKIQIQK